MTKKNRFNLSHKVKRMRAINQAMNLYLYINTLLSQEEKGFFFSAPYFYMDEALSPTKGEVCASIYSHIYP